ncbi:MAG: hypothetical protein DI626_07355 [Micavibrio aeruginosavorus]|uniref:Uncharacterized protein n=1 Tax=Micavibrio aeruginosavorus TaxID=349221 RepID=A0A2W4ZX08_9BACT|nr:MAG: hypothetical protein DI626_07355 [Micavibrio aeruginosavorus]
MAKDYFDEEEKQSAKEMLHYLRHVFCAKAAGEAARYVSEIESNFIDKLPPQLRHDYTSIIDDVKEQFGKGHNPEDNPALQKRILKVMNHPDFLEAHAESNEEFIEEMSHQGASMFGTPPKATLH